MALPARRSIFELVNEWCEWLEVRGTSTRTVDQYWRYLLAAGKVARKDPRDFDERDVVRVMLAYPRKGGGQGYVLKAMRSFFEWAEDAELLVNPARRIRPPRTKLGPAPRLSPEELSRMWDAAEDLDPRARSTLVLLYFTAARIGSLVAVTPDDLRTDRDGRLSIYFRVAKGGYPYELPLEAPEAIAAVERLLELRDWKPAKAVARRPTLVGVGEGVVWRWVSEAGRRAGVHAWPHLIRHTTLSDLAADPEVDLRTWVEAANHRNGSQLRRYAAASERGLRRAFSRLGLPQTASDN